jgi:hypothetical protein
MMEKGEYSICFRGVLAAQIWIGMMRIICFIPARLGNNWARYSSKNDELLEKGRTTPVREDESIYKKVIEILREDACAVPL